jgi:hypothetical protein
VICSKLVRDQRLKPRTAGSGTRLELKEVVYALVYYYLICKPANLIRAWGCVIWSIVQPHLFSKQVTGTYWRKLNLNFPNNLVI